MPKMTADELKGCMKKFFPQDSARRYALCKAFWMTPRSSGA